jgi:transposase
MSPKSGRPKAPAEQVVKDIRRPTRRQFSAEEKIRIVLEGIRGEESIAELYRREGIASSMYDGSSKEFLDAGKRRLAGDTARAATSDEVKVLPSEKAKIIRLVETSHLPARPRVGKARHPAPRSTVGTTAISPPARVTPSCARQNWTLKPVSVFFALGAVFGRTGRPQGGPAAGASREAAPAGQRRPRSLTCLLGTIEPAAWPAWLAPLSPAMACCARVGISAQL